MALQSKQRMVKYHQLRQKTEHYKRRRSYFRILRHRLYEQRDKEKLQAMSYAKGLMDPFTMRATVSGIENTHCYAKRLQHAQDQIKLDHGYTQ